METGSSRVLVVPRAGGGWELRETRTGPVLTRSATKGELVARARLMLESGRGGEIVVLSSDGSAQQVLVVEPAGPRPWWYVPPGLLRWLAPLFFVTQVARLALDPRTSPLDVALGVAACIGLVLVVVWIRRSQVLDRSRDRADVDPT